ncbi:PREDICTED: protein PBDC1-like [Branchiostoma belcheri]|uniref:Protein PBDC1-like n=1 Tax=Branchiostoma belcheri TaxID=7741 RepID=A0A6P5ADF2_BRABE|nr:PREDICTED: protein PBDC1-like [Branchiostoma belcheri]
MADYGLGSLGPAGSLAAAGALSQPAEKYINNPDLELAWASKAFQHAEVYFNLISSVDTTCLKLTGKMDEEIYTEFRKDFPDMQVASVTEDELKSEAAKSKWRPFCNKFEGKVADFNFGTLLRLRSDEDYSEDNSCIVPRIQFYAMEIARNREGHNLAVWKKTKEEKGTTEDTAQEES